VRARYYPGGFTDECGAVGSAYVPPVGTNTVLSFTSGNVAFSGGNLVSDFTSAMVVGPRNNRASGPGLTLTFSLSTGTFNGRAIHPVTSQSYSFSGAVLQKVNAGYGFLLGTNQSSQVVLSQ
jgi:hypothetical protein